MINHQPFSIPGGELLLEAKSLSCTRQDRVLFEQLSLQLRAGDLLQVAGKNGAGKSSLLRLLSGLAPPDEGQICYAGKPLPDIADDFAANLCFIGHTSGIHEQLTALENLAFWRAAAAIEQQDDFALLARLGLAGLEDIPCRMLSAGQQRRVSLARLWFSQGQLWILDEPFTALDQSAITMLQQFFLTHLKRGGAIVLTTHQSLTLEHSAFNTLELAYRW